MATEFFSLRKTWSKHVSFHRKFIIYFLSLKASMDALFSFFFLPPLDFFLNYEVSIKHVYVPNSVLNLGE